MSDEISEMRPMHGTHSSKYRGKVTSVHRDYEDPKMARLEIELAGMPKPKAKKGEEMPYVPTRTETVSDAMAKGLSLDDEVEVVTMIRHIKKK